MCIGQKKREGTKIKCWGPKVETKKNNEKQNRGRGKENEEIKGKKTNEGMEK